MLVVYTRNGRAKQEMKVDNGRTRFTERCEMYTKAHIVRKYGGILPVVR